MAALRTQRISGGWRIDTEQASVAVSHERRRPLDVERGSLDALLADPQARRALVEAIQRVIADAQGTLGRSQAQVRHLPPEYRVSGVRNAMPRVGGMLRPHEERDLEQAIHTLRGELDRILRRPVLAPVDELAAPTPTAADEPTLGI